MSYDISIYSMKPLSEYVEIQPGFAFKSDKFIDDIKQIPLVKGENVQQGYVDWKASKYWASIDYDNLEKYHLVTGDIVLAMDRPWVTSGLKWSYIKEFDPKSLLVQRVARLRAKTGLDQTYLRCLISSKYFSGYIQPIVTGVNVPHISGKQIGDFQIPLPELNIQRKIAAILSAYDDLIENNKRRISILENMAEEIYREWFIRFRFPEWKDVEFVKGIPTGWDVKKIGNIFKTSSGGTPSRKNLNNYEGDINWLKTGELKNTYVFGSEEKITLQGLETSSAKVFHANTVIIAMYCAMPDITILAEGASTNQACCAFLPKYEYLSSIYTYYLIKFAQHHMIQFAHGAAQQNLSQDSIKGFDLLVAEKTIIMKFSEKVDPVFEQIQSMMKINQNLVETRERLLPRLISGKLSVENLDIQFSDSMSEKDIVI